jgi:hypothetical protein
MNLSFVAIFAVRTLFSLVSALVGIMVFGWGLRGIKNREAVQKLFTGTDKAILASRFIIFWIAVTPTAGVSMTVAAVLVWTHPGLALVLELWPPLVLLGCVVRKRSRRRTGGA